jgi:hypothetical protein
MLVKLLESQKIRDLINIFELLKNYNEFITLQFNGEGLYSQSMDASNISLFELKIDKKWFSEYHLTNDTVITVRIFDFVKILSANKDYESLSLSYVIDEDESLNIIFDNFDEHPPLTLTKPESISETSTKVVKKRRVKSGEGNVDKKKTGDGDVDVDNLTKNMKNMKISSDKISSEKAEYTLILIELQSELLGIPADQTYNMKFIISSKKFIEILNKLTIFDADNFNIIGSNKNIQFKSSSSNNDVSINLSNNLFQYFRLNKDMSATYSYKFIKMCINDKITDNIELSIDEQLPLNINYLFENNQIVLNFYLAPKMDEE